jgi:hypothetical protein
MERIFGGLDTKKVFNHQLSLHQCSIHIYIGMLVSLWLFLFPIFLFAAQPKEFFLDGLKKLEQKSHMFVELRGGICRVQISFFNHVACSFLYKAKDLSAPLLL